jgi:hypothetical protein
MIALTSFVAISLLTGLSYWTNERWLLIISGFGLLIFGLYYVASSTYIGILIALAGIYTGARGLARS